MRCGLLALGFPWVYRVGKGTKEGNDYALLRAVRLRRGAALFLLKF